MFIWTGFDYISEPTPYDWPARSSYFGIMDRTGFPKDCYYLYKKHLDQQPVLHVFPHWNEQPGLWMEEGRLGGCMGVLQQGR